MSKNLPHNMTILECVNKKVRVNENDPLGNIFENALAPPLLINTMAFIPVPVRAFVSYISSRVFPFVSRTAVQTKISEMTAASA